MKKKVSLYTTIMIAALTAIMTANISVYAVWSVMNSKLKDLEQKEDDFKKFSEVSGYVDAAFVGEFDEQKLMDGAMKGYINALNDRWSAYLTKEEYEYLKESLNNTYTGIGIVVVYSDEQEGLLITKVQSGSSADRAGIEVGDLISGIAGLKVSDIGYYAAVDKIKGEEGTEIIVEIIKHNSGEKKTASLKREKIITNVITSKMLENNIGYLRIDNFDANADTGFSEHLDKLISKGAKGIIFDVRNNNGGDKDIMVHMLDRLLPEGLVFSMKNKQGEVSEDYSDANEVNLPMAVLVNKYSYSAAEFFAAALQEYGKACIIGEKTTGKGYAQSTIPLSDGSGLYLSVQTYYTPKGVNLAGVGISPDIEVAMSDELTQKITMLTDGQDVQLTAAIKKINELISAG